MATRTRMKVSHCEIGCAVDRGVGDAIDADTRCVRTGAGSIRSRARVCSDRWFAADGLKLRWMRPGSVGASAGVPTRGVPGPLADATFSQYRLSALTLLFLHGLP